MWAWGYIERVSTGLLGGLLAGRAGGRWNTVVAVGVTIVVGLAIIAILVSSRRSVGVPLTLQHLMLLLPAPSRPSSPQRVCFDVEAGSITAQEWRGLFTPEGKLEDGRVKACEESSERNKLLGLNQVSGHWSDHSFWEFITLTVLKWKETSLRPRTGRDICY
ncbi:unnamed protein product [Urochloa humidicola]